jgi:hypothetical protein
MNIQNKRVNAILITVAVLLLVPLIAMQFTDEVKWSPMDFLVMGVLLLSTGLGCELAIRRVKEFRYRVFICLAILTTFFIIWLEFAVGIF